MKKLTIKQNSEGDWFCLCGNNFAQEGFEEDKSYRHFGIYLTTCLRCGRKFDGQTLEVVGVRFSNDCRNELISKDELVRIFKQNKRYFQKRLNGLMYPYLPTGTE